MTLPKFVTRGGNTQKEQKTCGTNVPTVKHTDLLKDRFLVPEKAPKETNPQEHEDESTILSEENENESVADERRERGSGGVNQ
jgi:hypothetical protein